MNSTSHWFKSILSSGLRIGAYNTLKGVRIARIMSTQCDRTAYNGLRYLSQEEAINLDKELFEEYHFCVEQLMELAGLSVASAIAKIYPLSENYDRPIVCCGPGNNGGDGLVCARHLKMFGYSPLVICPKPGKSQLYQNLMIQCEKCNIKVLNQVPKGPLGAMGNLVVDSIFGFSYKPPNRSADFSRLLKMMHEEAGRLPLVSVDIPSGWNVETGYEDIETNQKDLDEIFKLPALSPECLISLTAPKLCARKFTGKFHYLGGRFCPKSIQEKYRLNLPDYPGTESVVLI